jgi:purine-cytosine permease-like protein
MAEAEEEKGEQPSAEQRRDVEIFGRKLPLPQSRWMRILIGILLVVFGIFGFLPILGFWMIPLGLLVLSYEFAIVRRWRRRLGVWWEKRRQTRRDRRS